MSIQPNKPAQGIIHIKPLLIHQTQMTTASLDPSKQDNEPLIATAEQLSSLMESFIELGVLVHDNQGTQQSHTALIHKTNQVVSQLSGLTSSPYTNQYPIPIDVISYIEDGRNPDIYTREFIEVTAKSNARLKGKMQGFGRLRDVLGEKLGKEFPRLVDSINDIKKRTDPPNGVNIDVDEEMKD
ncbi:NUT2 [[Candida] subhashii]|uniref:Mediator of RNA polymerase II transcription subunit 10 n=1 Tax=[Candida] subhashii TaxID=561895 RepID=A0A8J5QMP4_9ASCO|nr:NUT2 [[Candida] subhashii]KAG7663097.1 NUT2 [[Candida] subhashii]